MWVMFRLYLNTVIGVTFFGVVKFLQLKYSPQVTAMCTFVCLILCSKILLQSSISIFTARHLTAVGVLYLYTG